jgi:hypothetical protein
LIKAREAAGNTKLVAAWLSSRILGTLRIRLIRMVRWPGSERPLTQATSNRFSRLLEPSTSLKWSPRIF